MISTAIAALLLMPMQQVHDAAATAHDAYTHCLRAFLNNHDNDHMTPAEFGTALDQQCTTEMNAFREAVIARERSFGSNQHDAEQSANDEISDAKGNFRDLFAMSHEPHH